MAGGIMRSVERTAAGLIGDRADRSYGAEAEYFLARYAAAEAPALPRLRRRSYSLFCIFTALVRMR